MLKRFRSLINEVENLGRFIGKHDKDYRSLSNSSRFKHEQIISHTPSKHLIVKEKKRGITRYSAYNPRTKQTDMTVDGHEKEHKNGYKTFKIGMLSGNDKSEIKAHELYHHLITHHKVILKAAHQSEGGFKVWQRLKKHKDVNIHGWNDKRNVWLNNGKKHKVKEGPVDVRSVAQGFSHADSIEKPRTAAMNLVAHRKAK